MILPARIVLAAAALLACTACAETPRQPSPGNSTGTSDGRKCAIFNNDFRFALGEIPDAKSPGFDDSRWSHTGLPHSFAIPYFRSPHFPVGEGWYRKHFSMPRLDAARRVRLDFEAAFQDCDVFLNGRRVGGHQGGYTGFSVDLTPALRVGDNVLAVRVDNRWNPVLPPRAGEHVFAGGIYRDVRIVETDALHVPRNGLRVTTPEVSREAASVAAALRVCNTGSAPRDFTIDAVLTGPDGKPAGRSAIRARLEPGAESVFAPPAIQVAAPRLWHPDHPHLYTLRTALREGDRIIDTVSTRAGIRWFEFTADKGFSINGEHLWLRGANRHQDHAGWGDAIANTAHARDARLLKECGMNFVRGSHYPHDPTFLDACDELGLIVLSENTFWGIGGFGPDGDWTSSAYPVDPAHAGPFEANNHRLLGEMIDDHFNHPCIVTWSLCNEPFFTNATVMDKARGLVRDLVATTHRLDPSRPATVGGCQRQGFDKLGDIAGYNGDGARFPNPGIPSIVAEYGSHIDNRPGVYDPTWGDTRGERPAWRSGNALWCGFHHGSIAGDMGRMGMIDHARLPLRQWYWYRDAYAKVPPPATWPATGKAAALRLASDRTRLANDGTEDAHLVVTVLDDQGRPVSNSPEVTLEIVSGPGELPTGPSITFRHSTDIDIREGQAAIAFRSWHGGSTRLRATSPGLASAEISIETIGLPAWQDSMAPEWRPARTYRPKPISEATAKASRDNLAFTRPTRASSAEARNPADLANDGDPATRWCADGPATPAWWQVDLENFYLVEKVALHFEKAGDFRYRIETSLDNATWTPIAVREDPMKGGQPDNENWRINVGDRQAHAIPNPTRARFLRVTLDRTPADTWPGLREVQVSGRPSN